MINRYLKAALPYGFVQFVKKKEQRKNNELSTDIQKTLSINEKFRDIHKGERCFIVGTGPSIKSQNLLPLKNETVFSLSRFYHHEHYKLIKPKYQVFSGLILHPHVFEKKNLPYDFYHEAEMKIISDEIFTHCGDKNLINTNQLFNKHQVNYIAPYAGINDIHKIGIDLTQSIFGYYVISELAIQIALFMGFKEIYLLGLDHTWLKEVINNRKFDHQFYPLNTGILGKKNLSEFNIKVQSGITFQKLITMYSGFHNGYNALKEYGETKGIKIYNATKGGMLEIFERIELEEVLKSKNL